MLDAVMRPLRESVQKDVAAPAALAALVAEPGVAQKFEGRFRPFALRIGPAPEGVRLAGDEVAVTLGAKALTRVEDSLQRGAHLDVHLLAEALHSVIQYALRYDLAFRLEGVPHPIRPLTLAQVAFMHAILRDAHQLVFGVGPTGTGKTHLALAAGLSLLAEGTIQHLVITRPNVLWEGEVMTAPKRAEILNEGQFTAIADELHALIGHERTQQLIGEGKVEVVPLGRLRGRTLNDSFILVDDAQNLPIPQMRMVLTRLGHGSRMVVVGDPEQIDLHGDELSGLPHILGMLAGRDLAMVYQFERAEIIRNPLVTELEALYTAQDRAAALDAAA